MNHLLCRLFHHRTSGDRFSGAEYMDLTTWVTDGVGRQHCTVTAECARCGERFRVGMIHLPHSHDEWMSWHRREREMAERVRRVDAMLDRQLAERRARLR